MSLVCPRCKSGPLEVRDESLTCPSGACGRTFPVVRGVPVLIHDENSVFAVADYQAGVGYEGDAYREAGRDDAANGSSADAAPKPRPSLARRVYRRFGSFLVYHSVGLDYLSSNQAVARAAAKEPRLRVLVLGCGSLRFDPIEGVEYVYTDVAFGPLAAVICDAHDLPFEDASVDMVVAVAIMEHVVDPPRCADEIRRVLRPGGYVYAATPFMQPVHMGAYDFTRFSHLGQRRLFRWFDEIESGMALGPGAAMAWSIQYFLLSLTDNLTLRKALRFLGLLFTLPLKYTDLYFRRKAGALDFAGGTLFFGRLRDAPIADREMVRLYRGKDSQTS